MLGFARGDLFSAEFTGFASILNCRLSGDILIELAVLTGNTAAR